MNDNNELDALLATIEHGLTLAQANSYRLGGIDGDSPIEVDSDITEAQTALATLRTKLATMEAEREILRRKKDEQRDAFQSIQALLTAEQPENIEYEKWAMAVQRKVYVIVSDTLEQS